MGEKTNHLSIQMEECKMTTQVYQEPNLKEETQEHKYIDLFHKRPSLEENPLDEMKSVAEELSNFLIQPENILSKYQEVTSKSIFPIDWRLSHIGEVQPLHFQYKNHLSEKEYNELVQSDFSILKNELIYEIETKKSVIVIPAIEVNYTRKIPEIMLVRLHHIPTQEELEDILNL